jgi:hypothetical protein
LAAVPVDAKYGALLVFGAGSVLDLLLDAAPEEALASFAGVNAVVESRGLVAADATQYSGPIKF